MFSTLEKSYPSFFDEIKSIKLYDELSKFLGVFNDGIIEFTYLDIVKSAGHSCVTVAGAYVMTLVALKSLYKNEIPKRGGIEIFFKNSVDENNNAVISNVIGQITGASYHGFKGMNGKFIRDKLIHFDCDIREAVKFKRLDTNQEIEITYNPTLISMGSDLSMQEKVEKIFQNIDKVVMVYDRKEV